MSTLLEENTRYYSEEKYPGLAALDYCRRYLDGLISILEGYLLTFSTILITVGISFSMFDFLSGGAALANPLVFNIWALIQTIAIDAQFINMWYRLKLAWKTGKKIQAFFYLLLGVILAFVTFGAAVIPALQKSLNLSFDGAIYAAGLSPVILIWARSFVAILLAIIGAFSRTVIVFDKSGMIKNPGAKVAQKLEEKAPISQPENEKTEQKAPRFSIKKVINFFWKRDKKAANSQPENEQKTEQKPAVKTDDLAPAFQNKNTQVLHETLTIKAAEKLAKNQPENEQNTEPLPATKQPKIERKKPLIGLSVEEVLDLDIVKKNHVKKSEIVNAIRTQKLETKSDQSVTKSALKKWLKTREVLVS